MAPAYLLQTGKLLDAFNDAVDAFNKQNLKKYLGLLHNDVVVSHIHDLTGTQTLFGITDVTNYLNTKVPTDKPKFTPSSNITVDSRSGIVKGSAQWDDLYQGNQISITIDFLFIFVFVPKRGWLILNLSASPH
jgi:hypothetical protein